MCTLTALTVWAIPARLFAPLFLSTNHGSHYIAIFILFYIYFITICNVVAAR